MRFMAEQFCTAVTPFSKFGTSERITLSSLLMKKSLELIFRYLHYPKSDNQALFADFTICPTERYKQGASQPAIVKRIRNAHVVAHRGK